ncbi:hypothetical protein EZV62_018925 [Acer yangbiense]|uniref:DUF1985 domain-containing protein n=1 Tax=Acer yangbiense TaxID=1000413 RepID=A0A5C7HA66_9ROSI|nr:hypothetical protein EZV62_018925 [Acer yangbiense]
MTWMEDDSKSLDKAVAKSNQTKEEGNQVEEEEKKKCAPKSRSRRAREKKAKAMEPAVNEAPMTDISLSSPRKSHNERPEDVNCSPFSKLAAAKAAVASWEMEATKAKDRAISLLEQLADSQRELTLTLKKAKSLEAEIPMKVGQAVEVFKASKWFDELLEKEYDQGVLLCKAPHMQDHAFSVSCCSRGEIAVEEIEKLTKMLEKKRESIIIKDAEAKDLAELSRRSKDILVQCIFRSKNLEKEKQNAEEDKAEIEAFWEKFKSEIRAYFSMENNFQRIFMDLNETEEHSLLLKTYKTFLEGQVWFKRNGMGSGQCKMMAPELVPKIEEADFFCAKVTCLSSLTPVSNINLKLTEKQKKMFECTCFGHLHEMDELVFSSQTVHELLLREAKSPNTDEMWFKLGDNRIRFSIQEFCVVTCLNCSPYLSVDVDKRVKGVRLIDGLLNGDMNLYNNTLEDVFMNACCNDDLTMVKLALLYFLENVLLGREKGSPIDSEHILLADNLGRFNEYPWGRICFEMTMKSLQGALKGRVQMLNDRNNKKSKQNWEVYSVGGFPLGFLVWSYEAIPSLGCKSGHKLGCALPRLFNWQIKRAPNYMELRKIFSQENLQAYAFLQPTPEEEQQHYFQPFIALGASEEQPTLVQDNATSAAAPTSSDENAITASAAEMEPGLAPKRQKVEHQNFENVCHHHGAHTPPQSDSKRPSPLAKAHKNSSPPPSLSAFPVTSQSSSLAAQASLVTPSTPAHQELEVDPPTLVEQHTSVSAPPQGIAQPPFSSLGEARAFFAELNSILDDPSQSILATPKEVDQAKHFLQQCLSMNFELLVHPTQRDRLNSSLELLLEAGCFPSCILSMVKSFHINFLRNIEKYSNCHERIKRANKNEQEAMVLRGELETNYRCFNQIEGDICVLNEEIEDLTKQLEHKMKLRINLEAQAKDVAQLSRTTKDTFARCRHNSNNLEKVLADIDALWDEFKTETAKNILKL